MSQSALAELSLRREEECKRTGESAVDIWWSETIDMGDVSAQQLLIGELEFSVLDYGDRLAMPMQLRIGLNEGHNVEKNQCSIIHMAAGLEWHLQNRPNRFPLKSRVLQLATELRGLELRRANEMVVLARDADQKWKDTVLSLTHDIITSNRDRDFRFWPLFNGEDTNRHEVTVRIVELNTSNTKVKVYNYARAGIPTKEDKVIYMLAHRGHMRFMKQSRLATDTRRGNWREAFGHVIDLPMVGWSDVKSADAVKLSPDVRQCRHCPVMIVRRVHFPGCTMGVEGGENRLAGKRPKRVVRTDEQRREANQRWAKKYEELTGQSLHYQWPSPRTSSLPPASPAAGRTGVIEEVDKRTPEERYRYKSAEECGLPVFYPPPRAVQTGALVSDGVVANANVKQTSEMEHAPAVKERKLSIIEVASAKCADPHPVWPSAEMRLECPLVDPTQYDADSSRLGANDARYPIHDLDWRTDIIIHDETREYMTYVKTIKEYDRETSGEVIRLGNQMVVHAGGYRQAAREVQELNFRKRSHVTERIRSLQNISPAIAPELIKISTQGVIPEYKGFLPPE